jgi:hypothetical protein
MRGLRHSLPGRPFAGVAADMHAGELGFFCARGTEICYTESVFACVRASSRVLFGRLLLPPLLSRFPRCPAETIFT